MSRSSARFSFFSEAAFSGSLFSDEILVESPER